MRTRTLLLVVALGGVGLATLWHQSIRAPDSSTASTPPPPSSLASSSPASPSSDTLSDAEALDHVERLYRLQADLVQAQSQNDAERVESVLHTAIQELGTLVERPGLAQRPRFRRVFHSLTNEYETRYGLPDTLRLPNGTIQEVRNGKRVPTAPAPIGDILPADLQEQNPAVPLTINRRVKETVTFLLRNKERHLYPWLRRASTYFPMIEQIFAEEGVPDELKYLALAESGLNPYAQSRAQAAGIWQFVAETGRRYGLSIDPWVDERLDPEKATRAAARHLKDLHDRFGDWQLALAGYNCDPGVVAYHVHEYRQRTGRTPSFWDIYDELPEETRNYVPLYTATALIISNPVAFDLKRVPAGPRYAFDYVPVDVPLTIDRVAALAEVDVQKIRVLNPELRSNRLPPSDAPYYVRLPHDTYSTFAKNFAALPEEEQTVEIRHVLQPGETIGQVAERYHVERSALLEENGGGYPVTMRVGERLSIPETQYAGNARIAESADAQPLRIRYGSRTIRPVAGTSSKTDLTAALSPPSASAP